MRYSAHRTDRFVNNQSLRRIAIGGIVIILAAAAVCAVVSYFAAYSLTAMFTNEKTAYHYPQFRSTWLCCFWVSFGISGFSLLSMLIWSYRQTDRIYRELALLAAEAERLSQLPEEIQIAPLGSETGEIRRLCNQVERLARRTHAAYGKLVRQKKLHTDLLVNLSHQLKTSLAVIRLNRDMLESLPLPEEEQTRLAEEITLHLDGMEDLILNVLKLSRLSADAVQYQLVETDIAATCSLAAERVEPLCREHGIAVKVEIVGSPHMQHDRVWFCEAVENLLKNAVDHAECTEVKVVLTELPSAVKLQVIDNGRGIPLSEIPHLFDRFRKTEQTSPQNTGVGMAISKEIFSAHGGAITVYSGDSGTQFLSIFMQ